MPDRRQPDSSTDDNPFAAPPEGKPDQPWQPRGGNGAGGPGGGRDGRDPTPEGPARWDPTDPIQRRARYALLAGMWGFFFGIFGIPSVGLLLGALALYWGVSALRGGVESLGPAARPQRTAAVSGLVTATLALMLAAGSYAVQLTYKDFYVCRDDALTKTAELECNTLLPDNFLGKVLKVQR
ncbi:hypothetical protein [Streptomyces sp. A1136]|uniref:hypothetical protein n=1 Tax=Streptomyces sp. A1136 TaxID=2563102 RepID=UPI00109E3AB8|nr:hypothetical protein [Streptomyces sp. A1136]THA46596.1 hypothetical protein E6R62_33210 [Streptomyces sp. A1136]